MHFCECGCGQEIEEKHHHKWYGTPRFVVGHNWKGKHHSNESLRKMSDVQKGHETSDETKRKISEAHKGRKHSDETKQKMSKIHKGRKFTDEHKKRLSDAEIGEKNHNYGKHNSEETRKKISEANKGEKSGRWKGGKSFEPYCEKFNNKLKESIRAEFGYKCVRCGKTQDEQMSEMIKNRKLPFRLSIHHIDFDKNQGCNGKKWLLVPLCIYCHNWTNEHQEESQELFEYLCFNKN